MRFLFFPTSHLILSSTPHTLQMSELCLGPATHTPVPRNPFMLPAAAAPAPLVVPATAPAPMAASADTPQPQQPAPFIPRVTDADFDELATMACVCVLFNSQHSISLSQLHPCCSISAPIFSA